MRKLEKQKENKADILEDMLSCITYTPNRESDILAFMEQYQKAERERRPAILKHLRSCMDGGEYPNPYAGSYHYTAEDVSACDKILDNYIENLAGADGDPAAVSECVRGAVSQINDLNEKCDGCLIDTWRRERLCGFINSAAESAGLVQEADLTLQHRMW